MLSCAVTAWTGGVMEQLIVGLRSQPVHLELLRHKKPTLDVVIDTCCTYEAAERDAACEVSAAS